MAEKPTPPPVLTIPIVDDDTALADCAVVASKLLQGLERAPRILATAMEARHFIEASKQDVERAGRDLRTAQQAAQVAKERQQAAEVAQAAAENAAKAAIAEAKRTEDECAARIKKAEGGQAKRLAELDAEAQARRDTHAADHAKRAAELEAEIGAQQARLSDVTGRLAAIRAEIPSPR